MRISDWSSDVCSSDLPLAKLRHLLAGAQHDRVLADQIDAADVAVEVDPDARPVQPRGDLLDMRRLAGAVIALHHHAAIVCKARENRHGRVGIEDIARVQIGHPLVLFGKEIGRASCRERVCQYVEISVVAVLLKKKKKTKRIKN